MRREICRHSESGLQGKAEFRGSRLEPFRLDKPAFLTRFRSEAVQTGVYTRRAAEAPQAYSRVRRGARGSATH